MPRLHGLAQRRDTVLYDAFSPKDLLQGGRPYLNLFGNRNIGISALTNLQIAGSMGGDESMSIFTWYARTNVSEVCRFPVGKPYETPTASPELARAWDAWANASTATMRVGTQPAQTRPLSELFGPRSFGNCCGNPSPGPDDTEQLADRMWRKYREAAGGARDQRAFADLGENERAVWRAAAGVLPFRHPVYVPTRQNFGVTIESDVQALTVLLKVLPENIAPRPLVWVHLGGVCTMHVQ